MRVPQLDLSRAAARIRPQLEERWSRILDATSFVGGSEVEEFEAAFASFVGTGSCVGVANGTDAIELALRALELQPGDEVVVPAYTFVATAATVILAGGRPVLADVEPRTLNLDPEALRSAITERTVGVIGVHLYGRPFSLGEVQSICESRGLWLIEDAAQAHGAMYAGQRVGSFGRLATWSFYPSKNLGAFGDGGAVSGRDPALLERVRRLANHGREDHFTHGEPGRNSRLDALQAAVLNCRLACLDEDNAARVRWASHYRERLADVSSLELLDDRPDDSPVFHQFTILHERRDALREHLASVGIGTAVHYPRALHQQAAIAEWCGAVEAPVSERAAATVLCLPMFPELTEEEVETVCVAIRGF